MRGAPASSRAFRRAGGTGSCRMMLDARARRLGLRDEVGFRTRNAIVIGPAIDDRTLRAPVAMRRRRIGRLPFQRGRAPGVGMGLRTFERARSERHTSEP